MDTYFHYDFVYYPNAVYGYIVIMCVKIFKQCYISASNKQFDVQYKQDNLLLCESNVYHCQMIQIKYYNVGEKSFVNVEEKHFEWQAKMAANVKQSYVPLKRLYTISTDHAH